MILAAWLPYSALNLQDDHILWEESTRKNFPTFNYYYENYFRRATGLAAVKVMQGSAFLARFIMKSVAPHVPWVSN